MFIDANGNVRPRVLNGVAFNGFTESDPLVNALGKAALSCTNGQIAKYIGTNWLCSSDLGLTGESDPLVNALGKTTLSCANGQTVKYNGSTWICAADVGLTTEQDPIWTVEKTNYKPIAGSWAGNSVP